MATPKRTKDVLMGVERMAGHTLGRRSKRIRADLEPLVKRLRKAKSLAALKKALSAAAAAELPTETIGEALTEAMTQADLVGRVAAQPRATKRPGKPVATGDEATKGKTSVD